jgi:hypothetical protein
MNYYNIARGGNCLGCFSGYDKFDAIRSYVRSQGYGDRLGDIRLFLGLEGGEGEDGILKSFEFVEANRTYFDNQNYIYDYLVNPMDSLSVKDFDIDEYYKTEEYELPGVDLTSGLREFQVGSKQSGSGRLTVLAHDKFEAALRYYGNRRAQFCADTGIDPHDDAAYRKTAIEQLVIYEREIA